MWHHTTVGSGNIGGPIPAVGLFLTFFSLNNPMVKITKRFAIVAGLSQKVLIFVSEKKTKILLR